VNRKELSAVVAECAEVTQRAAARTEAARAGIEVARERQEEAAAEGRRAAAETRALTGILEKRWAKADARWEKEQIAMREAAARSERMLQQVTVELREGRDERRALLEALFRVMDRLPPSPPDLRSA
jgi:hypothetical protein